ncbi:hypothetical protein PHMEG_0003902 [Phytophthora megakarya]|uniref:Uncharacterized protein n=1 Tax=Phytophthora megakarya TaxID=4795 RepID=A0A225WV24_9STRA|nr:hypothetical protein PHMEG_0003902 [Phytophthora megakarya]
MKKVATRNRIESENVFKPSESQDGADVMMEQFFREFAAVLQLTKEKQSKELTFESFGDNAHQEVAFFGDIAQKLVPLVDRLMKATPDQIHTTKKIELLLAFGDKFHHAKEFRAASMFFYENILLLDEMAVETFPQQGVLERILASPPLPRQRSRLEGQIYIRSLFGVAMCCFHVQQRSDELVKYPGKLEKMIEALTFLRFGMEIAVTMERQYSGQFSWLTLNGTVLIYSIAKPLQTLGFSKEVVAYLKWSLLVMESAIALCTTKYIMWRLQLGSAICDCYEDLALKEAAKAEQHAKSAVACATYIQQAVQRLRKEEELDIPLPADVQRVLTEAETTSAMLVSRMKTSIDHQPLTKSNIVSAFPSVRDQIRVAIDSMETLSREFKQQRGGQETSSTTIESSTLDPEVFPMSFHLVIIQHCFHLAKPAAQMLLLTKSADARLQFTKDATTVKSLLELFDALHEMKQSLLTWENLSEDERLQSESKSQVQLPMSGVSIPASNYIMQLSKAMQDCVFHGDGTIPRTNQDLLTSVALQMWREFAFPIVNELDATEPSQLSKPLVKLTCELLLAIHFTFTAVKFEDLLLHGHVCLRLATLLSIRGKARRASQVVRQCLERINMRRNELVNFSSHFHSVVEKGSTTALSNTSFSCTISDLSSSTTLYEAPVEQINARDHVGVPGTGSQLGGLNQDMYCIQVDLLLLLYRLELHDTAMIGILPLTGTKASASTLGASSTTSTVLLAAETKLIEECHQNGYAKVLLNIQRLAHPHKSVKERRALADKSIQLLLQLEAQEEKLRRQLSPPVTQDLSSKECSVPAAPIVISRSSSAITVQILEYHPTLPSLRKKRAMYYMVFAKSAGAGTAVSLSSNRLSGTASPIYPPHLQVTISGLLPNECYVFAVAAFDRKHELIHSIGETSEPVVALNPLPLSMCYGYLAKACHDAQLPVRANTTATFLYNAVVSHICARRPSWMANPFYRQALKRDAVAQFPIPILNLCIQALLILCHNEPGNLERDGKLITSSDLDARSLTTAQTKALEDSRKISMAIEIACATDNQEAIRLLSFKGYRLLLPLLHLKGGCDGLTFAALVTYYQALHVIPNAKWDVDTRSICARVSFELFRLAQVSNSDLSRVSLPLILAANQIQHKPDQVHTGSSIIQSEEDESFRDVVALFKLARTATISASSRDISTPAAAMVSPRGAGAKGTAAPVSKDKSQRNTPQATPREADKGEAGGKLPSLSELLHSLGGDLEKIFLVLEQHSSSDRRTIEFASKICGVVLGSGRQEVPQLEKFITSLKVTGEISSQFRATLISLGGGALLPELKDAAPVDVVKTSDPPLEYPPSETAAGADDYYLYRWCGELFFIKTVLLYRKIAKLCDTINRVDTVNGPATEDSTYDLLHNKDKCAHVKQNDTSASESVPHESELAAEEADHEETAPELLTGNQLDQLFDELLEKSAGCCKLFRLANSWQALQAVAHQLWNAIWLAWVSPSQISTPTRLTYLSCCIDALLDMMDLAVNGSGNKNANTPISTKQSMALSITVYAATEALNFDQTWFARLMAYSLRAFSSSKDWKSIVQKGSRYHFLCGSTAEGSRFSEQNFPILTYVQQQIVNHQEALVKTAQKELTAYVAIFHEQEAKKKKKKSRLVVEEVLSPEEITFRANKQEMERQIQDLVTERNIECEKLADLSKIYDGLCKSINKSHQALNTCHELIEKYRRLDNQEELAALRRQIIASYNRCVILSRQKRQTRIVCQALHEVGDFHLSSGDFKAAAKSWLESLDNAFSTLNVGTSWRDVLTPAADQFLEGSGSNKDKIAGDELWVGMQCCSVLSKLIMYSSGANLQNAIDYALMAAAIFTRFYGCSMPHPTKCFLYGSYRILGQFWPGRNLLADPDRVFPFSLGIMFVLVPEVLLQYKHQHASTAMPVIAGYEYVVETCLEDKNHVANARRLRVEALVQCGRFQEAFQVLMILLRGGAILRNSSGNPELDTVIFHDGKAILDEANQTAMNWLVSLDLEQTQAELRKFYHEILVMHILASILHLVAAMARHETRYDRDTAIARSAAKKIAHSLLLLVKSSEATNQISGNVLEGEQGDVTAAQSQQPLSWEELQLYRIRADIHLQLSYLAFYDGDWTASKASSEGAIDEYNAIHFDSERPRVDLDQKLQFSFVFSRGTFLAKCRSQFIACCLAQAQYHAALETAQVAIEEATVTREEHLRQQLELQRLQTAIFLGERENTERELFALREDALAAHTSASLTYVRTLQTLSSVLRSRALLSSQSSALNAVCDCLSEAELVLDALLEHDGWIGISSDNPPARQQLEKRINLYRPVIPDFIQVHADLAQVLLECPVSRENENVHMRKERALRSIENGIRALEHTTQQMHATKARLLLLKSILLSKALNSTSTQPRDRDGGNLKQRFEQCVDALVGCIKSAIEGGYDRQLVRSALIALVDLFGQKLIPDDEDAHVQAAFHYLNLALEVHRHESILFDTFELQNGTIAAVEKLPAAICASIKAQSETKESAPPPTSSKPPEVGAIVNYFVRLLRMQHILPVSTGALQDTSVFLHSFLMQHHSTYTRTACMTNLPSVPPTDPEIRAGLVCAIWGQDLAPAIMSTSEESTHNTTLMLYFTLGTTKMTLSEGLSAADNDRATARMEKFASSPLLSKRCNLDRQRVQCLKTALSNLRTDIEDEESLLADRTAFPKMFHEILCKIQQLFRKAEQNQKIGHEANDDVQRDASMEKLCDAFGNLISIACTLEVVRRLEDLFSINKGTNVADNELCYFLRDLLD